VYLNVGRRTGVGWCWLVERPPFPSYILSLAQAGQLDERVVALWGPSALSRKTVPGVIEQNIVCGEDLPGNSSSDSSGAAAVDVLSPARERDNTISPWNGPPFMGVVHGCRVVSTWAIAGPGRARRI